MAWQLLNTWPALAKLSKITQDALINPDATINSYERFKIITMENTIMPLFHCGKNSSVRENVVNSQAEINKNKNLQNNRTTTTLRGDLGVNTPPSRAIQQTK